MKKALRLLIISALLLGILIPVFDYYNQGDSNLIMMAQESRKRNIKEFFKLAKIAFYEGNYNSAEYYYKESVKLDPFDLESRRNLAVVYNEQGNLQSENETLNKIAILSKNNSDYLNLAISFYKLNNNLTSIDILKNKVEAKTIEESLLYRKYYYLIKNFLDLNQYDEAEKYLIKISDLKINRAETYLFRAELNKAKGNFILAYQNYQKAYLANKSQSYLYKDMALMLEKAGKEIEAYQYWQKTLAYGWFKTLVYQKLDYYQNKYPYLKADQKEPIEPKEIKPFLLEPSWQEQEKLESQKKNQMLRIGLQQNNKHLLFQSSAPFSVISEEKIIYRGEATNNYLIQVDSSSIYLSTVDEKIKLGNFELEYQIHSSQQNSSFYVYNINYGQGYFWQGSADRQYRGDLIIKGEGQEFTLINQVELTPYLISVVPSEIYASWPEEALKAQAVAARSYTLNNLGRHKNEGYDLCSSVHCAAYKGVNSEAQRTTSAVLATQGEKAVFEGAVIEAVFSSNSGGFTERSDQIWSADLPYLRGVSQMKNNDYNLPLAPAEFLKWLFSNPESYSKDFGSSNYRWQLRVPAEVIEYRTGIDKIRNIRIKKRAQAGTITSLSIYGEEEQKNYSSSQIRRIFGGLKNSRIYFDSYYDQSGYLKGLYVYGAGWGHNLGLDQAAAAGMGAEGWDYQEIIKHFYPGVKIEIEK